MTKTRALLRAANAIAVFAGVLVTLSCSRLQSTLPEPPVQSPLRGFQSSRDTNWRVTTYTGTFGDGATYIIEVPSNWNRTLLLFSHPLTGGPNPADDGNISLGPVVHSYLLRNGYALGGSSYASIGYAVASAFVDQMAVLDTFNSRVGAPRRTIAWGESLGGGITDGLIQMYPHRFSAALPMCGLASGMEGLSNEWLDAAFALNILLASHRLHIVHITNADAELNIAATALANAQANPQGRARIDLVAALWDLPGWNGSSPNPPEPSPTDYEAREAGNYQSLQGNLFFLFAVRQNIESFAGGNPSFNTGVNYRRKLGQSVDYAEVKALYAHAGLSLSADLDALNDAPRISADPQAMNYLRRNISFNGDIEVPVLSLHTIGDDLINVQAEQAYAEVVHDSHDSNLLREVFIHRAGHCNFTAGEILAALHALITRLDSKEWQGLDPEDLNSTASALGPTYNVLIQYGVPASTAVVEYKPAPFLRPFDLLSQE